MFVFFQTIELVCMLILPIYVDNNTEDMCEDIASFGLLLKDTLKTQGDLGKLKQHKRTKSRKSGSSV